MRHINNLSLETKALMVISLTVIYLKFKATLQVLRKKLIVDAIKLKRCIVI